MIPRLYVPLEEPEDVVRHLGKKEKHWKQGKSAHALVHAWHEQSHFPPAVGRILAKDKTFQSAQLVDGFLERQTDLGSKGRPSQTDLLAIVSLDGGLAILAVEGKAGEPFNEYVEDWLDSRDEKDTRNEKRRKSEKEARLKDLCEILEISRAAALPLRYQLLHRTAAAIIEARRYRAKIASLIVHSFSDDPRGFGDFRSFLETLGIKNVVTDTLMGPIELMDPTIERDQVSLYAAWAQDSPPEDRTPSAYLDSLRSYAERRIRECEEFRDWCHKRAKELRPETE